MNTQRPETLPPCDSLRQAVLRLGKKDSCQVRLHLQSSFRRPVASLSLTTQGESIQLNVAKSRGALGELKQFFGGPCLKHFENTCEEIKALSLQGQYPICNAIGKHFTKCQNIYYQISQYERDLEARDGQLLALFSLTAKSKGLSLLEWRMQCAKMWDVAPAVLIPESIVTQLARRKGHSLSLLQLESLYQKCNVKRSPREMQLILQLMNQEEDCQQSWRQDSPQKSYREIVARERLSPSLLDDALNEEEQDILSAQKFDSLIGVANSDSYDEQQIFVKRFIACQKENKENYKENEVDQAGQTFKFPQTREEIYALAQTKGKTRRCKRGKRAQGWPSRQVLGGLFS